MSSARTEFKYLNGAQSMTWEPPSRNADESGRIRHHYLKHATMPEATAPPPETYETAKIGYRLRYARRKQGLLMKEVADRVGCSDSLISKIERGHATPSLRMLHTIAAVLNINIASLFDTSADEQVVRRSGERPLIHLESRSGGGGIDLEHLAPHHDKAQLEAHIHIVEPGAESDGEITHAGEEVGYLLEGTIELMVDDKAYTLNAGDSFYFRSELTHRYRNPGTTIARLLWVNTPPSF